ncbi:MAG: POT family proton-dependent oligopeptide transporter, partial [Woeseiaceae bacterium]
FWFSRINIENINFIKISEVTTYIILFAAFGFFTYILLLGKLNSQERNRVWVIIALFLGAAMFWAGFEQAGSSLNLFASRYIKLEFGWITLYSSWFQSINSIFIIIFAPMFAYMWIWLAKKNLNPSTPTKFAIGLLFLALGFFMMVIASSIVASGSQAMPTWLLLTYLFHTFGELALSPVGLSVTTKLAPKRFVGQMMGIWFVASALGNLIAGRIAGEFNANDITSFPDQYLNIVLTSAGAGIILLIISKPLQKLMGNAE